LQAESKPYLLEQEKEEEEEEEEDALIEVGGQAMQVAFKC
jgi:hypothetical protein